jgi:prepilin-type N-terminal cleavage/methylation domain-containing protein
MAGFWRIEHADSLKRGDPLCEQSGFTLVETIVAMLLVAILISGFVPLISYIRLHLLYNTAKVMAYNMAESQIEQIRSTSFDLMGTPGGNPQGINTPPAPGPMRLYNNIYCIINTQIQWEADPSRPQTSLSQTDYKEISVEVQAFLGTTLRSDRSNLLQDITVSSMVSREGVENPPGNNIIVYAQRGWNTNQNASQQNTIPAGDLPVIITSSGSSITEQTDPATGEIIFGQLSSATYSVGLSNSWNANGIPYAGMMEFPGDSKNTNQPFTVTSTAASYILSPKIHVETPCSLNLSFNYLQLNSGGTVVSAPVPGSLSGIATLSSSFSLATYSATGSSLNINTLWPVGAGWTWYDTSGYSLAVNASGYYPYAIANSSNPSVSDKQDWSGSFDNPGENLSENLNLLPLPAVYVTNSSTGSPINGATVTVYPCTWTYVNGVWGSPTQGAAVASGTTTNGYCSFNLPPSLYNNALVTTYRFPSPATNDTCTGYGIKVTKSTTTQTVPGAFWIFDIYNTGSSGLQMTWSNGVSQSISTLDYPVTLATS